MKQMHLLSQITCATLSEVSAIHCQTIKSSLVADTYTSNNILKSYMKCKDLNAALKLFDEMPHRDTASCNTIITGHVKFGNFTEACQVLKSMKRLEFLCDGYTFGSMLKGTAASGGGLMFGQQLHSDVIKMGLGDNVYAASSLLDMYAKCNRVGDANKVFEYMPERNKVSWNALISGYAEVGNYFGCIELFLDMDREGVSVDDATFAPILALLDDVEFYELSRQLHGKITKHGLEYENTVLNALITAYSECGCTEDAKRVFDSAEGCRDLVTWNSMLAAFLGHGFEEGGFNIFLEMIRRKLELDAYSYSCILSACSADVQHAQGRSLHGLVIKRGVEQLTPVSNALISMYLKSNNNSIYDALKVFEHMGMKDLVSWNTVLTCFSQKGLSEEALRLYRQMHRDCLVVDQYSFAAVLRSCSDLATLRLGQQIHASVIKYGFQKNEYVASALTYMYSKCGIIEDSWKSFEASYKESSITWNAIMFACAQHGQGEVALDIFYLMRDGNVKMDHITFVAALTACSHIGAVEEGLEFLNSMESRYGVLPRMENYACAVDLLGRAGRLEGAKEVIRKMPFKPDAMVWKTLLGACRACGDIDSASEVASHLLELEPGEHCTYVLLSDMYGHLKMWDEKASVKKLMRDKGVKKVPGWSWIELQNDVHAFNAGDCSHPDCQAIYETLTDLYTEIKFSASDGILNTPIYDSDLDNGCWIMADGLIPELQS